MNLYNLSFFTHAFVSKFTYNIENSNLYMYQDTWCVSSLHELGTFNCLQMIRKKEKTIDWSDSFFVSLALSELLIDFILRQSNTFKSYSFDEIPIGKIEQIYNEICDYLNNMKTEYDFFNELCKEILG